jgi:hypothetical protein
VTFFSLFLVWCHPVLGQNFDVSATTTKKIKRINGWREGDDVVVVVRSLGVCGSERDAVALFSREYDTKVFFDVMPLSSFSQLFLFFFSLVFLSSKLHTPAPNTGP